MVRQNDYIAVLNHLLAPCVGRKLARVTYRTIDGECTVDDVCAGVRWIGGEVRLVFGTTDHVFLGWAENDGWPDHFSLAVQSVSTFQPDTLVDLDASNAPEWLPHVGTVLMAAACRGSAGTPHALILSFESGSVLIADGHKDDLGDGDDVLVRTLDDRDLLVVPEILWRTGR